MNLLDTTDIGIDYNDLSTLLLVIGGCLALIGALHIYQKWSSNGGQNIEKEISLWLGGIVILIIVQVFIKVMFNQ